MFSYKERFMGFSKGGNSYAPMTLGSPEYTHQADYSTFKKTKSEKLELAIIKAQHKRKIDHIHGYGSKRINP